MPSALATNPRQGRRSEIYAQKAFTALGAAVKVPTEEDMGIDFYCTLGRPLGRRLIVEDYFLVQVKSDKRAIVYRGKEEVQWLTSHQYPFFIALVRKKSSAIEFYQTLDINHYHRRADIESITFTFDAVGAPLQFSASDESNIIIPLGAPILGFGDSDVETEEWKAMALSILRYWCRLDQSNISLKSIGIHGISFPLSYETNVVPKEDLGFCGNFIDCFKNEVSCANFNEAIFRSMSWLVKVAERQKHPDLLVAIQDMLLLYTASTRVPDGWAARHFQIWFNEAAKKLGVNSELSFVYNNEYSNIFTFKPTQE